MDELLDPVGQNCTHQNLHLVPSPYASQAGYKQPDEAQRIAAAGEIRKSKTLKFKEPPPEAYPASLILPGDDLSHDPDYEPQSLRSWVDEGHRNRVSPPRKTIYVIPPPTVGLSVVFMRQWLSSKGHSDPTQSFEAEDVAAYLSAFYTGMNVRVLPYQYKFDMWNRPSCKNNQAPHIGLETRSSIVRIRTRLDPEDGASPPKFHRSQQLNVNDLLDAMIEDLPKDAFAAVMLLRHDLYESDDDDFCMGRAYGGSRVCVVSMRRYDPSLDEAQGVDLLHGWPASHCTSFVEEACAEALSDPKRKKKKVGKGKSKAEAKTKTSDTIDLTHSSPPPYPIRSVTLTLSPMQSALSTYASLHKPTSSFSQSEISAIWLSRICRTAAHELGHCFGLDHCVYYACIMQSSASLAEDARQPPYLCPVDLAKLEHATDVGENERLEALGKWCEGRKEVGVWGAFGAWIEGRLRQLSE